METFGIWNLIKSILTSDGQPISSTNNQQAQPADVAAKQAENPATSSSNPQSEAPISTAPPPEKANACEEYLLRHERLSRGRKK